MRVQQMACHSLAWLTSTETQGKTRGSSSLSECYAHPPHQDRTNLHSVSFPLFIITVRKGKKMSDQICWLIFTHFSFNKIAFDFWGEFCGNPDGKNAEAVSWGKNLCGRVISLIMSPQLWQGQAGSIAPANLGWRYRHPTQEQLSAARCSARTGMASGGAITHVSQWEELPRARKQTHGPSPQTDVRPLRSRGVGTMQLCNCMSLCTCDRRKSPV